MYDIELSGVGSVDCIILNVLVNVVLIDIECDGVVWVYDVEHSSAG